MLGFLTNQRLWGCKKIVNHVSDYVYVHLMRYLYHSDTLIVKAEMKKIVAHYGRTIKHYQFNNVIFVDNGFVDTINERDQKLIFCVMVSHHQNGIIDDRKK